MHIYLRACLLGNKIIKLTRLKLIDLIKRNLMRTVSIGIIIKNLSELHLRYSLMNVYVFGAFGTDLDVWGGGVGLYYEN